MSGHLLNIQSVNKSFKEKDALRNVSLKISKGDIFGLIGHNGAGKTTLLRIITQILEQDNGDVYFDGQKLKPSHRYRIGYLPEERGLYKKMKVGEYLVFLGELHDLNKKEAKEKVFHWLKRLMIEDSFNLEIHSLSKGNQQKIQFIATVLFDPEFLILDEPFSGFDPSNVELIKTEIMELNKKGTTILFSTHQMETIEELCKDIALINKGEIVEYGSLKTIKKKYQDHKVYVEFKSKSRLSSDWSFTDEGEGFVVYLKGDQTEKGLLDDVQQLGLVEFRVIKPSLREVFLKIVQE